MATAEQQPDAIETRPLGYRGRCSAPRLSRDRALLASRLPEPRRAGFFPGGLRPLARARSAPPSPPSSARISRRWLICSPRPQPGGAERNYPINADVPSPLSTRLPDNPPAGQPACRNKVCAHRSRRPKFGCLNVEVTGRLSVCPTGIFVEQRPSYQGPPLRVHAAALI